jgi:UrcA family protein
MKTTTTRTQVHPRSLIAAAILAALIPSLGAVCRAADTADVRQTIVKYPDLDVATAQGAAVLYNRIRSAAEGVCARLDQNDLAAMFRWKACVKGAIAGAVTTVDQPGLSALYAAKYGALQPAKILTADRR